MIYAFLIGALALVASLGVAGHYKTVAEGARAKADACYVVNKSLDQQCRTAIATCHGVITGIHDNDQKRAAAAKGALDRQRKLAAAAAPAIQANVLLTKDPTQLPREQECAAVFGIVDDYAQRATSVK